MTVKELIQKLAYYNPDAKIIINNPEDNVAISYIGNWNCKKSNCDYVKIKIENNKIEYND